MRWNIGNTILDNIGIDINSEGNRCVRQTISYGRIICAKNARQNTN